MIFGSPVAPQHKKYERNTTPMPNILLIEDNAGVLESTQELLQLEGYQVHTAINGKEGFLKIQQLLPDIIISDILMPVMDGLQLLLEVAKHQKLITIPFIFLTAKSEKTDIKFLELKKLKKR